MSNYTVLNESIRLWSTSSVSRDTRSALATFCRRNGYSHLFQENLEPLLGEDNLVFVFAVTDRPWPPKGIGSQILQAVSFAMIGSEQRAHLTPVLLDRKHATNLGLASAVSKQLLESLRERGTPSVAYFSRQGDRVLERALENAGFGRSDLQIATEYAEYNDYTSTPERTLRSLGLQDLRLGAALALALDGRELDALGNYFWLC